jgi:(E)-4-hydroxy-3-methylbut-2-enyl-diphosphate synthase
MVAIKTMMKRRKTKNFFIGTVGCGHLYPVSIQSMTNTDTRNTRETVAQIQKLAELGCALVRVAVPDREAAESLREIVSFSPLPVIADIHFDYKLAMLALKNGVHGLRLNPGNIGAKWKVKEIVKVAQERKIPIRIGVNSGSLEKNLLEKYGKPTALAMVDSALGHIHLLEEMDFDLIKVSLKSSQVPLMLEAYRRIAEKIPYPLHLGVTEAGLLETGMVKSAIGIGTLLAEGIGDTIRVSLTSDPVQEIKAAKEILRALGLTKEGVEIISCPTCGRCEIDLVSLAEEIEQKLRDVKIPLKVAVMGCVVNGPGEAREADLGIAGGKGEGLLFVKGEIKKKLPEGQLVQALWEEIEKIIKENN